MLIRPFSPRRYARMLKRAGRLLAGRDVIYSYDLHPRKQILGTVYGGWTIAPEYVSHEGIVLSFGVGTDISFDEEMIRRFDVFVHAFDPSPHVVTWLSQRTVSPHFIFHRFGLAEVDGDSQFYSPDREMGMYSLRSQHNAVTSATVSLPVRTLASVVNSLQIQSIDVLKMDIEGSEYSLLPSILECPVPIKQLLIEFHHRIGVASLRDTINAVDKLRSAGFLLFHVSETSSEFSFLHKSPNT